MCASINERRYTKRQRLLLDGSSRASYPSALTPAPPSRPQLLADDHIVGVNLVHVVEEVEDVVVLVAVVACVIVAHLTKDNEVLTEDVLEVSVSLVREDEVDGGGVGQAIDD